MSVIDRDFPPDVAAGELAANDVNGCVVVQCVNTFDETLDLLAAAATVGPILGVVGWVDLQADVPGQVETLRAAPGGEHLAGIRHVTTMESDGEWLSRAAVVRGITALASLGLPFDIVVEPQKLSAVTTLARSVESATFVLDHLGNPPLTAPSMPQWADDLAALASCNNVVAKVSGLVTKAEWGRWTVDRLRPAVEHALDTFGAGRLMFGSDWPLAELAGGYRPWKDAYLQLTSTLTSREKAAIDAENATTVYSLS